jgi:hypothetical protein
VDLGSFTPLEGLLIAAVVALAGAIGWGFMKLLKVIDNNTKASTKLAVTCDTIVDQNERHARNDIEIGKTLVKIETLLEMQPRPMAHIIDLVRKG